MGLSTPRQAVWAPTSLRPILQVREVLGSRETFKQFDKDGDGVITANDLGHALFTLGQEPTDGELADMIKEVDLNGERGGAQGQGGSQGLFTLGQEPTDGELADMIKEVDLNGEVVCGGESVGRKHACAPPP